jgi:hypothetical protein
MRAAGESNGVGGLGGLEWVDDDAGLAGWAGFIKALPRAPEEALDASCGVSRKVKTEMPSIRVRGT